MPDESRMPSGRFLRTPVWDLQLDEMNNSTMIGILKLNSIWAVLAASLSFDDIVFCSSSKLKVNAKREMILMKKKNSSNDQESFRHFI